MRLINPQYVEAPGPLAAVKVAIDTWFAANTGVRAVSFDALRAQFNKTAVQWPDGAIHAQLLAWGYQVDAQ